MSTYRRSLTEDDVDRCNQTWTFYLLLLLFLVTWLLPLARFNRTSEGNSESLNLGETPGYIANCWVPAFFSGFMGNYMNAACSSAFNKAIRNDVYRHDNRTFGEAKLYYPLRNENATSETRLFEPTVNKTKNKKQDLIKNVETSSQEKHYIFVRTPLILFVLAICLKLPYIVWASVSSSAGLGFSHLLESARSAQVLDTGSRSQFKQDLKKAVEETFRSSSFFSSIFYLLLKVQTFLVTIVGLFIVGYKFLPKAEGVQRDLNQNASVAEMADNAANLYSGITLHCEFEIMGLSQIQSFTSQCMFKPATSSSGSSTENEMSLFWLYEAIFTILVVLFAVLSAINIISLLIWVTRLVPGPFRKKAFRNPSFSMDAYLLLYMARLNAGPVVSSDLEQCLNQETRQKVQIEDELRILPN